MLSFPSLADTGLDMIAVNSRIEEDLFLWLEG